MAAPLVQYGHQMFTFKVKALVHSRSFIIEHVYNIKTQHTLLHFTHIHAHTIISLYKNYFNILQHITTLVDKAFAKISAA